MRELSLFSGAGGGLLASHLLGWTPCGYVERDEYCQRVIAARIADGILPSAPIFNDLHRFNESGAADEYRGIADVVSAGFPCQPYSSAGWQRGADDDRALWPATRETICRVQPRTVFLENVIGFISRGYGGPVLCDLAALGYVGRWGVLGASDLGAPHRRKRVWIVAHAKRDERAKQNCWPARRMGRSDQSVSWNRSWESALCELRRVDDGLAYGVERTDAIRNGQVPEVAARAFRLLS